MTAMTREEIERFDSEHKEDIEALTALFRLLPADRLARLASFPKVQARLRALEQENPQ